MDSLPPTRGFRAASAPLLAGQRGTALTQESLSRIIASLVGGCGLGDSDACHISYEFVSRQVLPPYSGGVADLLLGVLARCLDGIAPISYLSMPISTGKAYLRGHDVAQIRAEVLTSNLRRAEEAVTRLRRTVVGGVIDPSRLPDVPGWTQPDYHAFWSAVIARYPERIIFLDEWQYSVGCTKEFADAVRLRLPTMTERLHPLNAAAGIAMVREAAADYEAAGVDSSSLRTALEFLELTSSARPVRDPL